MKCYACNETDCPVGVIRCDACKRAAEQRMHEQWKRFSESLHSRGSVKKSEALATLGVSPNATMDEIKRAYHAKALEAHPDKGGRHEDMVKVNLAYEAIGGRR